MFYVEFIDDQNLEMNPTQRSLSRETDSRAATKGVPSHHEFAKDYRRIVLACLKPYQTFHNTLDSRILRRINELKLSRHLKRVRLIFEVVLCCSFRTLCLQSITYTKKCT